MAKETIKPTESELEILQILWEKGEATVREVHEVLSETKTSGYTTTLKFMQIMFDKGLVTRDESAKSHTYKPAVNKKKMQRFYVDKMIKRLFSGSPSQLIIQALGQHKATQDDLNEIQKYLDNLKK
ncbi:MAG: BlaI/MecI/CopY family transcriptional regulator [Chitinophagaceae bacterium]|nr:BlaI/MecI/CopY family transcriptional regulator [Chitinophagaceae bacterium]